MAKWQWSVEGVLDTGMEKSATSSVMCASLGGKCSSLSMTMGESKTVLEDRN